MGYEVLSLDEEFATTRVTAGEAMKFIPVTAGFIAQTTEKPVEEEEEEGEGEGEKEGEGEGEGEGETEEEGEGEVTETHECTGASSLTAYAAALAASVYALSF